jgi:hypothetical protein
MITEDCCLVGCEKVVDRYQGFRGASCFHLQGTSSMGKKMVIDIKKGGVGLGL